MSPAVRRAAVTIAAALVAVQVLAALLVLGAQLTGHRIMTITGGSMEPRYSLGDAVFLGPRPANVATGDVVTFRSGSNLVTHRVVSVQTADGVRHLHTQGDANPAPDPTPVPVTAVVGVPRLAVPYGGYLITWARSPDGMLYTYGPALLLVAVHQTAAVVRQGRLIRDEHRAQPQKP